MNVNEEGGIDLAHSEVRSLALRAAARRLDFDEDWLLWEDYPLLSETAFMLLATEVRLLAQQEANRSGGYDVHHDIDSEHIFETVS